MRCFCASARQVARRLTRLYDAELGQAGMNAAQFELLANLAGRPGLGQTELATQVDVDQTTLSRNLRLLVRRGWVVASEGASDRRRIDYVLSEPGRGALHAALPLWAAVTERVRTELGTEVEGVWGMLDRLGSAAGYGMAKSLPLR